MDENDDSLRRAAMERRIVAAECRTCGYSASFLAEDLAAFADPARPIHAIRFRCTLCDGKDCRVTAAEVDRDRRPDIIVWRPTRLR